MSTIVDKSAEIKYTGVARVLVEYLEYKKNAVLNQMLEVREVDTLRQLQGRAHELTDLIQHFKDK